MNDKAKAEQLKQLQDDIEKAVDNKVLGPTPNIDSKVRPGLPRDPPVSKNVPNAETVAALEESRQYEGIAVLGSNPHTIEKAPWGENWRFYACSPHNIEQRTLPRVHEWFECHLPITDPTRQYEYLRRLEDNNVAQNPPHAEVIWARDPAALARWKDARPYPELEMRGVDVVGKKQGEGIFCPFMFTSSIAYIFAKAIVDAEKNGIKKIGIWGVMQASETEYTYQRPGIQYFIWEATRRGIQVIANQESKLFELPQENW